MMKTNLCLSGALGALVLSVATLGGCMSAPETEPLRLSVFMSHLKDISSQRGISVAAAAAAARSWGITGLDMIEGAASEETVRQVTAAGLEPVCYVIFADFTHSDDAERVDRKLDFAARNGFKRIMLVPGMLKKGEDREALWPDVRRRLAAFVRKAGEKGLPVGCEDFDSADVSVGSQAQLRRALAEIPGLEHVLDTGNYTFWKDDVLSALAEFRPRIGHVHVKDLDRADPRKSVAAGTGLVPVDEVVRRLRATGYDGWFVVECFGSKNAWNDVRAAAEYLRGLSAPAGSADGGAWPLVTMRLAGSPVRAQEKTRRFVAINAARPGSCDAYWFCGADGNAAFPEVERRAGIIASYRESCEKAGIEFSYQQGWTLGHYAQPYREPATAPDPSRTFVRTDESFARSRFGEKLNGYCPRSPEVLAYEEGLVERIVRGAKVRAIWLDDDCRLHKEPNWSCFCDRCIAAFNREEGLNVTREELSRRLFEGEEVDEIRGKWVNFNARSLALFGAAARRGADKADPSVRLCLQNCSAERYYSGLDYRPILWELSGHGRVKTAIRAGSGFFCGEIVRMLTGKLRGVMIESERLKTYGDWIGSCTYENDTHPREVMQKSSEAVMIENALALGAGCDALSLYWWDDHRDEPLEYYEEFADDVVAWRPYFARLADLARRTHAGGVAWERPADYYNRRQGPPRYTDGAQAFSCGNSWTNYWLAISGVPLGPSEGRPAARFTQADVVRTMRLGKNVSPTTSELEAFRDRLDELSGGKVPVRPAKTHRLVVLPRVGEQGELHAVTVWNVSIGTMRQMPLRLRNPAATKFVWARGGGAADVELQGVRGKLPGEWIVTLPDVNGYGVGTLFCE